MMQNALVLVNQILSILILYECNHNMSRDMGCYNYGYGYTQNSYFGLDEFG